MNILQINKYHYYRGGSETVFFNMIDLLRGAGHNVAPFATVHPKNLPSEYDSFFVNAPEMRDLSVLKKVAALPRFFYNPEAARQLQRMIDRFKPDVAHLHNIFNGLSLSILPVLKRNNIPVVITLHDVRFICPTMEFDNQASRCRNCLKLGGLNCGLHRCYEGSLLNSWMVALEMFHKEYLFDYDKYIDRYHFVSRHYLESYSQRHSYFRDKGSVFYQYVPTLDTVTPDYRRGDYMLFYGRLNKEKGIHTLVEAMKQCPDIELKVGGSGPLYDSLKAMNLPNVEYLGFLHGEQLDKAIRGASFVIVPSQCEENNPMSICESYSFGKPVIVSDHISEFVDKDSGFAFHRGDASHLAEVINNAAALTDDEYARLAHGARSFGDRYFYNREGYTRQLLDLYGQAIDHHKQHK